MASIYSRGGVLWMSFKNKEGCRECRSTGYCIGKEDVARELATTIEQQAASGAAPIARTRRAVTVAAYGGQWLQQRRHVASAKTDAAQLRLHVFPSIGHMPIDEVRPRHVRDVVFAHKQKTSQATRSRGEKLAPRTIRHVFAVMRVMFKSAVVDELITASPVVVEKGVLPQERGQGSGLALHRDLRARRARRSDFGPPDPAVAPRASRA